jgi:voltage-gated potassium channel
MKQTTKIEIVLLTLAMVVLAGTVAYHILEGWSYVDSFYFTGITMTTIGYGDLYPTNDLSKIFTVFFAFGGVSIMLFTLSFIATQYFERRERKFGVLLERRFIDDMKKSFSRKEIKKKSRKIVAGSRI